MAILDILTEQYGWIAVASAAAVVMTFLWQMWFWLRNFGRIPAYRSSRRKSRLQDEPPVSVVVPMFSENVDYVENVLPLLLEQKYDRFQVVVVYVGSDSDFHADLVSFQNRYGNLTVSKIEYNPRFPISVKQALNVGIKAAQYEHVVLTTTDARPATSHWIAMMAKGFTKADIVLGYCGMEPGKGLADTVMRTDRMMDSALWIAAAIRRRPYRGIRHNLGLTKSIYFASHGFDHLDMNIGEDDLYMQRIMRRDNVCVMVSPQALVVEHPWGGIGWWVGRARHFRTARRFYPPHVKRYMCSEPVGRLLFFGSAIAAMIVLPAEFKYAAAGLVALRYATVALIVRRIAKRMGETRIAGLYFIYDLLSPLYHLAIRTAMLRKDPTVWR